MIHGEVKTALETTGVPVAFHEYTGTETTFIVYHLYDEHASEFAENKEALTSYFFEVSVVSKGNYETLVEQVKDELMQIGGRRIYSIDLKDGDYYQRTMRFIFSKFN